MSNYIYTLMRTTATSNFEHLWMEFYKQPEDSTVWFAFKWQCEVGTGKKDEDRYFYGFRIAGSPIRSMDSFNEMVKLVRRLMPKDDNWFSMPPKGVIDKCTKLKIYRAVNDQRLNKYVRLHEVADPDLDHYVALNPHNGRTLYDTGTLAYTDEEARRSLIVSYAEYAAEAASRQEQYVDWLGANCPMANRTAEGHDPAPKWETTETLLYIQP